jgi:hypothetical protein
VDAEKFKSNRRDRILFLLIAHLLQQPSLDAAAAAELFCNSPATNPVCQIWHSNKYRYRKDKIPMLVYVNGFTGYGWGGQI